jgi:hypothetical protein
VAVSFALVHHANQFLITNGYETREGISDIVGSESGRTGILGFLAVHAAEGVPLNLHISGTLLEAISWHCPSAIPPIRECVQQGLVELIGSCYGQNIMRFFSPEYNRKQLNEELRLFEIILGIEPSQIKVFWPPERVWDTPSMSAVLRDPQLLNGGYRYVILDDRTLLSPLDPELPRATYDKESRWTPELYRTHEIEHGHGLVALPIGIRLRHSIPPKKRQDWQRVQTELEALLVHTAHTGEANFLALYADDLEKVTGVWGPQGPECYSRFLLWVSRNEWIRPVKLSQWTATNPPAGRRRIEVGTFSELAGEFDAGEGYEKWFLSTDWAPYREYFESTERRVKDAGMRAAGSPLIELAEKQLLVSNWETAWHTPSTGAHGDPNSSGKPSPWARTLTSHCRHALVTAEAACWTTSRDGRAHASICDVDRDGEADVVFKNDRLFGLVTSRWGGRLVALFHYGDRGHTMVVGNPCDDWNFLEELNKFMNTPRNHPGAFADVGYENDQYKCELLEQAGRRAIRLINVDRRSKARGMEKFYEFNASEAVVKVRYRLPAGLKRISIECALSPDYLRLLRHGSAIIKPVNGRRGRGFSTQGLAIRIQAGPGVEWERPLQGWIGHARTLRMGTALREFELSLSVSESEP